MKEAQKGGMANARMDEYRNVRVGRIQTGKKRNAAMNPFLTVKERSPEQFGVPYFPDCFLFRSSQLAMTLFVFFNHKEHEVSRSFFTLCYLCDFAVLKTGVAMPFQLRYETAVRNDGIRQYLYDTTLNSRKKLKKINIINFYYYD
jgi:hypothetical protein